MAYMALYRRYRPVDFTDVIGQDAIVQTLKNQIKNQRIAHAYLFCGTRGTGKTSTAKIFARAVNCMEPKEEGPCNQCEVCEGILRGSVVNMIEIDAASNNGVDDIRELREAVKYTPTTGRYKVYIIDEVHMLSQGAFNALLKTLEEPPAHVIFILATTDPQKIPPTILSRCQRFDFKRISTEDMVKRLQYILQDIGTSVEEEALYYIARISDGAMRDALSILDQCISFHGEALLTLEDVLDIVGAVDQSVFFSLTDAIEGRDIGECMRIVEDIVMHGRDIRQFVVELIAHFRNLLMTKTVKDPSKVLDLSRENINKLKQQGQKLSGEKLLSYIHSLSTLESDLKYASLPRVLLEVALVGLCSPKLDASNEGLLVRLEELEQKIAKGLVVQKVIEKEGDKEEHKEPIVPRPIKPITATDEEINEAIKHWGEILQRISMVSVKQYLLQWVPSPEKLGNLNQGVLYIRFEADGIMNVISKNDKKVSAIEEAVEAVTGKPIKVQCILEEEYVQKYTLLYGAEEKIEQEEEDFDFSIFEAAGIPVEIIDE